MAMRQEAPPNVRWAKDFARSRSGRDLKTEANGKAIFEFPVLITDDVSIVAGGPTKAINLAETRARHQSFKPLAQRRVATIPA